MKNRRKETIAANFTETLVKVMNDTIDDLVYYGIDTSLKTRGHFIEKGLNDFMEKYSVEFPETNGKKVVSFSCSEAIYTLWHSSIFKEGSTVERDRLSEILRFGVCTFYWDIKQKRIDPSRYITYSRAPIKMKSFLINSEMKEKITSLANELSLSFSKFMEASLLYSIDKHKNSLALLMSPSIIRTFCLEMQDKEVLDIFAGKLGSRSEFLRTSILLYIESMLPKIQEGKRKKETEIKEIPKEQIEMYRFYKLLR